MLCTAWQWKPSIVCTFSQPPGEIHDRCFGGVCRWVSQCFSLMACDLALNLGPQIFLLPVRERRLSKGSSIMHRTAPVEFLSWIGLLLNMEPVIPLGWQGMVCGSWAGRHQRVTQDSSCGSDVSKLMALPVCHLCLFVSVDHR